MRSAEETLAIAGEVLDAVPAGEAEVTVVETDSALTRFAANTIHQNVAETELTVRLRLVHEGRTGVAEVRGVEADLPSRLVTAADGARRLTPPAPAAPRLPRPDRRPDQPAAYAAATAAASPEQRADMVGRICGIASRRKLAAYGACETTTSRRSIASTTGLRRSASTTRCSLTVVVRGDDGAGYADRHGADIDAMDAEALGLEAVDTCERNQHATAIDPGVFEVVLAPYAVAEMIAYLSWMGFSALARQEGRSFMRPGERLMDAGVSIVDDATAPNLHPFPFDWEGVSSLPVTLVENGVCAGFVYDTPTAALDGVASTGHALPMPNTAGPLARNLALAAGSGSREDLVAGVRRGLYVTRFWYVRAVHELRTVITGMTREGTFRIVDGRLGAPVRDLRFTQSIVDALGGVAGISRERALEHGDNGVVLAPALHLLRFAFTS
ncbi:MAG: TldD/PmbA family protein [Chloroflexi bacterium]|nr:MAG: TldD/PmbA family protein [Chloroflexota bacterium]